MLYDARLNDKSMYPVAAKSGSYNSRWQTRPTYLQAGGASFLPVSDPGADAGSYDQAAAARESRVRKQRHVRHLPRAAPVHGTEEQPARSK